MYNLSPHYIYKSFASKLVNMSLSGDVSVYDLTGKIMLIELPNRPSPKHSMAHIWHTNQTDVSQAKHRKQRNWLRYRGLYGGRYRIRTSDFLRVRQARATMPQPVLTGQYRTKRLQ